jgi:hypothetical protein
MAFNLLMQLLKRIFKDKMIAKIQGHVKVKKIIQQQLFPQIKFN